MARVRVRPVPPQSAEPDLPRTLAPAVLSRSGEVEAARIAGPTGTVDAAHMRLSESIVEAASAESLDLTGAVLVDVEIAAPTIVALHARDGSWRTVVVRGGRIGTLELPRGRWDAVRLEDVRIDYLSTPAAVLRDVELTGCRIGTWDAPGAQIERMRLTRTTVDEFDTREMRASDLDLRGGDVARFTDVRALRGITMSRAQVAEHAAAFAESFGVDVRDS